MKNIQSSIREVLLQARISKSYKGYAYLEHAIYLVLEDETRLCSIYDEVYARIGRQFHVAPTSVEKISEHSEILSGKTADTTISENSAELLCIIDHFLVR